MSVSKPLKGIDVYHDIIRDATKFFYNIEEVRKNIQEAIINGQKLIGHIIELIDLTSPELGKKLKSFKKFITNWIEKQGKMLKLPNPKDIEKLQQVVKITYIKTINTQNKK